MFPTQEKTVDPAEGVMEKVKRLNIRLSAALGLSPIVAPGAESTIDVAESTIDIAESTIDDAESTIDVAESSIDAAESTIDVAESTIDVAKSTIDVAESTIDVAESTIDVAESTIDIAESTIDVADSTIDVADSTIDVVYCRTQSELPALATCKHDQSPSLKKWLGEAANEQVAKVLSQYVLNDPIVSCGGISVNFWPSKLYQQLAGTGNWKFERRQKELSIQIYAME